MSHSNSAQPRAATATSPKKLSVVPSILPPGTKPSRAGNLVSLDELDGLFRDFLDYAETFLNHSRMSLDWYRRSYRNFRKFLLDAASEEESIFRVRLHSIEDWVRWNRRQGLSTITTNTYWRGLRSFFKSVEKRHGRVNPFKDQKPPQVQRPIPKAKTGDECSRILDSTYNYPWPEPYAAYRRALAHATIGVMLLAGLRRGEVIRLKFTDIQVIHGTIRVHNGKGTAGGRDRMAYISPDLREILLRYIRERDRLGITQPEFFVSVKTRQGISLEGLRKIVEKVRRASGIAFTAHMLRHSFITHLLRSDVPLHITKELAGHKDIATTLGYLRIFDEDLQKGIRKIRFR
jgi:site-specific recombinase XerD